MQQGALGADRLGEHMEGMCKPTAKAATYGRYVQRQLPWSHARTHLLPHRLLPLGPVRQVVRRQRQRLARRVRAAEHEHKHLQQVIEGRGRPSTTRRSVGQACEEGRTCLGDDDSIASSAHGHGPACLPTADTRVFAHVCAMQLCCQEGLRRRACTASAAI